MTLSEYFGVSGASPCIVPHAGRKQLGELFAARGYAVGVEIGTWEGRFARTLFDRVTGLHLTCVDPWRAYGDYQDKKSDQARLDAAYATAQELLKGCDCRLWRVTSLEAAAQVADGSVDFIYLDANHAAEFVRQDIEAWAPKVRSGGVVSGHDYSTTRKHLQVKPAVDAYIAKHHIAPLFVLAGDKSPSFAWEVR